MFLEQRSKRFSSWESQHGQGLFSQLRKQCVLWLGAKFVDLHIRHVYLHVMCQLVPTLSSVFYCWLCLLWPVKHLVVCVSTVRAQCFCHSTWFVVGGKCFICVSTNNGLQLTTHPPQSSAHSPPSKKNKTQGHTFSLLFCRLSLPSFHLIFPSSWSLLFLCSVPQSAENQCRTISALHDSAHVLY